MTLDSSRIMTNVSSHRFDARNYIESVAYSKAERSYRRSGQSRADFVFETYMKAGLKMWADLTKQTTWKEAEKWLRLWFGKENVFMAQTSHENAKATGLKPGPKCWAKYTVDEYKSILKKVDDSLNGSKSESNRKTQLKTAVNSAVTFLDVKPWIYEKERHGKWISESEFGSMLKTMKEIVAEYAAVSTTEITA